MVGEYLLDDVRTEWFQVYTRCLSPEQRFTSVLKNPSHHGIYTTASNKVYV